VSIVSKSGSLKLLLQPQGLSRSVTGLLYLLQYVNARALHCFIPATGKQILTEGVERSHRDSENDGARCFRRPEYGCKSLAAHSVYVTQPKPLVPGKGYHLCMSTEIRVKRMGIQLEVSKEKVVYHLDGGVTMSIPCTSFCGLSTGRHHVTNIIKVKVKVNFTLKQAMKEHRGSRGIVILFL